MCIRDRCLCFELAIMAREARETREPQALQATQEQREQQEGIITIAILKARASSTVDGARSPPHPARKTRFPHGGRDCGCLGLLNSHIWLAFPQGRDCGCGGAAAVSRTWRQTFGGQPRALLHVALPFSSATCWRARPTAGLGGCRHTTCPVPGASVLDSQRLASPAMQQVALATKRARGSVAPDAV